MVIQLFGIYPRNDVTIQCRVGDEKSMTPLWLESHTQLMCCTDSTICDWLPGALHLCEQYGGGRDMVIFYKVSKLFTNHLMFICLTSKTIMLLNDKKTL